MSRSKSYQHFCPVARSLEVIGEKWSLLIVRDLLRGSLRFTDLKKYLGGISPKWLSLRLQELERVGIVERLSQPGRRQVWYRLTEKGRGLEPVIAGLAVWGIDYAMRPPAPDEAIYPEQTLSVMSTYLNASGYKLRHPAAWNLKFGESAYVMRFDGARWKVSDGTAPDADIAVETSSEAWVGMLTASAARRATLVDRLAVTGRVLAIKEFKTMLRSRK